MFVLIIVLIIYVGNKNDSTNSMLGNIEKEKVCIHNFD